MTSKNKSIKYRHKKQEAYIIIGRLYNFLKEHPESVSFKKLNKMYGYYDGETEEIVIDYRRDIIPTLIHEFIHHIYSEWSETRVERKERRIMSCITPTQCRNIIKILADALY